jgi:hypothetical protein
MKTIGCTGRRLEEVTFYLFVYTHANWGEVKVFTLFWVQVPNQKSYKTADFVQVVLDNGQGYDERKINA